ncbi:MAG TPA: NAD-binding protein, partial [Sphingopyxis sp.]|nr:NAD-binding protein [Sphingopyxis sp.]
LVCGRGEGLTVIEDQKDMAAAAEKAGARVIVGDATKESILRQAGIEDASTLLIAIPEGVEAGAIVRKARAINARLVIVARAHSDEEVDDLVRRGADHVVMAERVTAARMAERAMLARA